MAIFMQWTLPAASGLTADDVVNTFTFTGTFTEVDVTDALTRVQAFYNEIHDGAELSVAQMINDSISRSRPMSVKAWDVTGATTTLGEPDAEELMDVLDDPISEAAMPREVSMCLSTECGDQTGLPPRRRRGRIFVGPLIRGISNEGIGQDGHRVGPNQDAREALVKAGVFLARGVDPADPEWAVWSRAGNQIVPVNRVSVDNAFDTQRRRGEEATNRLSVPII